MSAAVMKPAQKPKPNSIKAAIILFSSSMF